MNIDKTFILPRQQKATSVRVWMNGFPGGISPRRLEEPKKKASRPLGRGAPQCGRSKKIRATTTFQKSLHTLFPEKRGIVPQTTVQQLMKCAATFRVFLQFCFFILSVFLFSPLVHANNLSISNISIEERNPSSSTCVVKFDVSWDNSWRSKINHDAVWITVRLLDSLSNPSASKLSKIFVSGLNPSGTAVGSNSGLEIYVPSDKYGAFIRRNSYSSAASVSSLGVQLTLDYSAAGFSNLDSTYLSVFGLEMVYIPEGSFYAGDYDTSTASLDEGSSDTDPWRITSESAIPVTNASSNGYRYVSNNNSGEESTGASFSIPATFPKGYQGFYCMKYEITEGQWVEFVNSLVGSARNKRDLTDNSHKNSDAVLSRNTMNCSGSPLVCSCTRQSRAVSYLSWMDLSAFLDWAALRPMTELEYEKVCRGPKLPVRGEYAWGKIDIFAAAALSGSSEDGSETVTTQSANVVYNDVTLSGGDSSLGVGYQKGPLRSGIFSTSTSTRTSSGAGYYGVMEFSGNLVEHVVSIGNITGRSFIGNHGDGSLTTTTSYEGNANVSGWVGLDATTERGVTAAAGSGFKGGSWQDSEGRLRISDRANATLSASDSQPTYGGRGVRTYDGN